MARASNELRYEDYLASSHRPAFDGMRGIGFLLVITAHIPSVPLFGYLQGWTAVWLFFAISGYLVTMLMMREEKSHGRRGVRAVPDQTFFPDRAGLLDGDPDLLAGVLCAAAIRRRL